MSARPGIPDGLSPLGRSAVAAQVDAFAIVGPLFGGLVVAAVVLVVLLAVRASRKERQRREELYALATRLGWHGVTTAAPLPPAVADAARSRRTKLMFGTWLRGFDVWMVWHQWTESTGSGDSNTTTTHDLTRYFLWLGRPYPNLRLQRRTRVGGFLKPVRGTGTGDAEFDKRFLVRGDEHEAARALTPDMRHALLTGAVPVWETSGGVLVIGHAHPPRAENLQPWAEMVVYIAGLLP